jgi:hypothetical protein
VDSVHRLGLNPHYHISCASSSMSALAHTYSCSGVSMAPISRLLTVVITTSPVPSNPSTELISSVLHSFRRYCTELTASRVVVVFDTFSQIAAQSRLKKGHVTAEGAKNFYAYKDSVKKLILQEYQLGDGCYELTKYTSEAEYGSPQDAKNVVQLEITHTNDKRVTFIEPSERLGFGLAVRSALRVIETPYVWIHQHDWVLVSHIPLGLLLEIMQASEDDNEVPVKYLCLPSIRMLSYATSSHAVEHPTLRLLTSALKRNFVLVSQPKVSVTLTPLFFWHDKPHIAQTAHYLSRVFPTSLALRRGDFIEDKIGQRARAQMKEGLWHKWASWLYYPEEGRLLCLKHLQGRTWNGSEYESHTQSHQVLPLT